MLVSGFTFIRNGSMLGYPYEESIRSALALCDEFVIAVGKSDDDTLERLRAIGDPRLRIIETTWNEKMADRGYVYAQQKMIAQFNCRGDWAFYLEGDEVLHEADIPALRERLLQLRNDPEVESLVFDYHHFYGSPQWVAIGPGWYRRAPRIIRNSVRNYSPDGLFFVVMDKNKRGRYPRAALAGATIYHYGHVRPHQRMQEKLRQVSRYWGHQPPAFDAYAIDPLVIRRFAGNHPAIMADWLANEAEREFTPPLQYRPTRRDRRHRVLMRLERWFGLDFSKKHFRLVRK